MSTKKKAILISSLALVVLLGGWTWLYPYSPFSLHKSYSFTPDPVVVDGYAADLGEFKRTYEKDLDALHADEGYDYITGQTQYILPLFEQEWLLTKEPVSMSMVDLGNLLFEVKTVRKTLLDLLGREDFPQEKRMDLVTTLEGVLALEEAIVDMKTGKAESRKTLNIQYRNLHGSFLNNYMRYEIFYERAQME
ncbi:hypothetical protein [Thalassobacillus hwangdonensis]|uniref:Uncharacterized protein n=1 Tax=Thalassobacillus hwangdonensis TaxID=546108 RepID=A0ABW3L0V0_9BACI